MKNTLFTGAGVALVTPLFPDGTINFERYRALIDWQIEQDIDAIITCGTTGESSTLSHTEHLAVMRAAVEQAAGRVPVIAGTGSNDTAYSVELSREAAAMGADGLLLVTPYYNKTSQKGLLGHFFAVADAVDLPIILYNVPSRTGMDIKPQTVATLAEHKNIVAIKEASGNIAQAATIASLCDIDLYSGNDDMVVPLLSLGGKGVISVLANVDPRGTHEMCAKWFAGDVKGSAALQIKYMELIAALFSDVNPIPVKAAMNRMGMNVGPCRLPLCDMADTAALEKALRGVGLL